MKMELFGRRYGFVLPQGSVSWGTPVVQTVLRYTMKDDLNWMENGNPDSLAGARAGL